MPTTNLKKRLANGSIQVYLDGFCFCGPKQTAFIEHNESNGTPFNGFENTLNDPKAFNVGRFDPKEENVGTGMVGAPACGDVMKLQIKCEPSGNTHVIKDVKFKTYGCGSAIASSSELVDMLIGKTLEEAKAIKNKEIVDALELPPIKIHCSVLAEDSIKQAIEDYESKQ